mmetsp:Transcript_25034/g.28019  ORF Transcript_25034/g.28019 Transcript_25034/m.28019 type:complete len:83 (-) Transcript_25034:48-296(-)
MTRTMLCSSIYNDFQDERISTNQTEQIRMKKTTTGALWIFVSDNYITQQILPSSLLFQLSVTVQNTIVCFNDERLYKLGVLC